VNRALVKVITSLRAQSSGVRFSVQLAIDSSAWVAAIAAAVLLRLDFDLRSVNMSALAFACIAAILVQALAGWFGHLYRGRHAQGSFAEVEALVFSVMAVVLLVGGAVAVFGDSLNVPRSLFLIAGPAALLAMGAVRYFKRLVLDRSAVSDSRAELALVYGAGDLGSDILRRIHNDPDSAFRAVGLIDDAPSRRKKWINRVPVLGTGDDLAQIVATTGVTVLIVAVGNADAVLLRKISNLALVSDVRVLVFPPLNEILQGKSRLRDLRDISIEDLIGRSPLDTRVESVAGYLTGKRVLVTGAGGSIGAELCRQIHRFGPSELIMLDHDETNLQSTQISILGHGLLDTRDVVLASIRDRDNLLRIFNDRRPEVVFHAAALKHLPMLQQYPVEAWETNVLGTLNVLEAARAVGVQTFVNISTDKAANPTSVLGHSKRLAEQLTAWAGGQSGERYLSVRFGNVIGSRGSMLPTFSALIEAGGPLTITHPDVTRYFMTILEACQLVVQAGSIGDTGEVLILDMGEPVRIDDVARRMIELSGRDVTIVYTGLRPGEKLHEELVGVDEVGDNRVHPKIAHTAVLALSPESLNRDAWLSNVSEKSASSPITTRAVSTLVP
jgi:dTDP-glucose 4,6-dehydratase